MNKKIISLICILLALSVVLCSCGSEKKETSADSTATDAITETKMADDTLTSPEITEKKEYKEYAIEEDSSVDHPIIKFTMENGGTFSMKLYPEYAPETVENFVSLVESGFYDGLTFHRIIDGFMAQGGDPEGTGMGGSDKNIKGEFMLNGFRKNTISHQRGVVSMARSKKYDSASSQFFICYDDCSNLDGGYAAFGYVFEGMETVDAFLEVERTPDADGNPAYPVSPVVIATAEVVK